MIYKRKHKLFNVIMLLIIMMICFALVYDSFYKDIYSLLALEGYKETGLRFFYSIFNNSIELRITLLLLLPPSNLLPYDLLQEKNNHFSYMLKTRLGTKKYLFGNYVINFIETTLIYISIHILILLFIHIFLVPIEFVDDLDFVMMQSNLVAFSSNCFISLIIYIFLSSIGYASFSSLILSLKNTCKHNYYYRSLSLLVGIILIALPAMIGFKIYSVIPNENILTLFTAIFLPSLITPGLQNISGFKLIIHPLLIFLLSFTIYNLCAALLYYSMSMVEYKNE